MSSLISSGANIPLLTPTEAAAQLKAGGAALIDVREPEEWAETGVAELAVLLALSDLRGERTTWKPFLEGNREKTLLLWRSFREGRGAPCKGRLQDSQCRRLQSLE